MDEAKLEIDAGNIDKVLREAASSARFGVDRDRENIRELVRGRSRAATELLNQQARGRRVEDVLGPTPDIVEIEANLVRTTREYADAFREVKDNLTIEEKTRRAAAELALEQAKAEAQVAISFNQKMLNLRQAEQDAILKLIGSTKELSEAQKNMSKNAERGRNIIENPGEVFSDLRSISNIIGRRVFGNRRETVSIEELE